MHLLNDGSGKQHDVAECMDNCMFQIETALLKFDAMSGNDNKTSIVKRCVTSLLSIRYIYRLADCFTAKSDNGLLRTICSRGHLSMKKRISFPIFLSMLQMTE